MRRTEFIRVRSTEYVGRNLPDSSISRPSSRRQHMGRTSGRPSCHGTNTNVPYEMRARLQQLIALCFVPCTHPAWPESQPSIVRHQEKANLAAHLGNDPRGAPQLGRGFAAGLRVRTTP